MDIFKLWKILTLTLHVNCISFNFSYFLPKSYKNQSINNLIAKQTFTLEILGLELKPYHYGEGLI
ncbi:hypothetical protein [Microcoleus sp.]|uniref:hypothetical protein n=1 Tax=Microcoleus sp. TaxID=44472 RepID=UPI00403E4C59